MSCPGTQHIGGAHGVYLCVQVVVVRMGRFQNPLLDGAAAALDVDLMLCGHLFGVFPVTSSVDHPATGTVLLPHASCDHIFVLAGVNEGQGHAVGFALSPVHLRELEVSVHRVG